MPSTIAELGYVIERHCSRSACSRSPNSTLHQRKLVQEKRAEFEARTKQTDAFSKSHFRKARNVREVQHRCRPS